ncbi:efflux RND transporter periplasmic adaptor subunit [Roseomonas sp. NAR14]|uniref:Efflux RND transporter periplasmic adaptor subunit n=1 Tax=Roseomonas acroporae TaxID=2937791 RepID=A0A9X1YBB9_9PROT|nr:efflux RND transporter periplasmic adaptor subunit [Roseomonas acroporae]
MRNRRRLPKAIGVTLAVALVAALGYAGWSWFAAPEVPAGFLRVPGRLEADLIEVTTRAGGRLTDIAAEGAALAQGATVARFAPTQIGTLLGPAEQAVRDAIAARTAAEAETARRRAERDAALDALNRALDLQRRRNPAPAPVEARRATLDTAEGNLARATAAQRRAAEAVSQAEAAVAELRAASAGAAIPAPRAGRVIERAATTGGTVAPGGRVATLMDPATLRLVAQVPAEAAARLAGGAEARVLLDGLPDLVLPATASTGPPAGAGAGTVPVTLRVPADRLRQLPASVRPGAAGTAWLRLDRDAAWPDRLAPR